ncbi:ComGF family competence protein [Pseudogracilibacillus sp. SO30301A]|uniref:ComGF family competence protein n=1 Tax=Pseudogracilibacillus sp. SO30301A TaxID=3098291 RepID=UPI00300E5B4D
MKRRKRKRYVSTDIRKSENGATFLSILITFVIVMITLPLLVYLLTYVQPVKHNNELSVNQFFIFLRNDVLTSEQVYTDDDNKMYFLLPTDEVAHIEQYQNVIRRQVNGRGHEIYLRDIDSFTLQPISFGTQVTIVTKEGREYEKKIAHYE